MTSILKSETSRANGKKSRGPIYIDGLEKSSANAVKHGLTSESHILIAGDDAATFQKMLDDYVGSYEPVGPHEKDLVEEIVHARWRIHRLESIEAGLFDDTNPAAQLARSFRALAGDSHVLELSSRYESRLPRVHDKAFQMLMRKQEAHESSSPGMSTPIGSTSAKAKFTERTHQRGNQRS